MSLKILPVLLFAAFLFTSCSHVYTPALYHQDIAYQPKPASFDSVKVANYVSAGLNLYSNTDLSDALTSGQLNLSRAYVFKGYNLSYGAFGVAGDYSNTGSKTSPDYFSDKFFGALGARASADLYVTSGRFDIRYIGFEAAYSHEFGSYADFRQSIQSSPNFDVDPRTNLFTLGLTSEVIFHNTGNSNFQNGIRGFLGTTFGRYDLDDSYLLNASSSSFLHKVFPKASYFIKIKNYFGTVEVGSEFFIRLGLQF